MEPIIPFVVRMLNPKSLVIVNGEFVWWRIIIVIGVLWYIGMRLSSGDSGIGGGNDGGQRYRQ